MSSRAVALGPLVPRGWRSPVAGLLLGLSFGCWSGSAEAQMSQLGGGAPPPAVRSQLSPIQELHRNAYHQALQAGYHPQQARAHADAVVQQHRPAPGMAPRMNPATPSPAAAHPAAMSQPHWRMEQQRVAQQQQMAAAQQNERLWQALQQQRMAHRPVGPAPQPPVSMAQAGARQIDSAAPMASPRVGSGTVRSAAPIPAQVPGQMATPAHGFSDSEFRHAKSASSQLARLHSVEQRNSMAPAAAGPAVTSRAEGPGQRVADVDAGRPLASESVPQVPARLAVGAGAVGAGATSAKRSVLEASPGPVAPRQNHESMPGAGRSAVSPPAPRGGQPSSGPAEPPVGPLRTPRRLPAVDPQPLQRQTPSRETEIPLEGFTDGEPQAQSDDRTDPQSVGEVVQVAFQQPAGFQSYASQQYSPQLDSPSGSHVVEPPSQLVTPGGNRPTQPLAGGFQVEAIPSDEPSWPGLELPPVVPNGEWREIETLPSEVPHPAGRRVARGGNLSPSSSNPLPTTPATYVRPRRNPQDLPSLDLDSGSELLPPARAGNGSSRLRPSLDDTPEDGRLIKSCAELRQELLGVSLRDISLDLSTPASSLTGDPEVYPIRDWRDSQNQLVARGRAISATTSGVRIIDEAGNEQILSLSQLGAQDQKYAWDVMDLPFECGLSGDQLYCRSFAPTHVSWHASNLCHKPLYFEDIQLERYGHTVGPIRQPVKSAVKFLGQAALLPYQMSLSPPNECEYPLGLFRPGNCAPYLRTPFPWERRAVGYQAGVTAGLFLLVP